MTLFPPTSTEASTFHVDPRILVDLKQGSYFALRPKECAAEYVHRWFAGNIYDLERSLPVCVELPASTPSSDRLEYELFVSGDYEVTIRHEATHTHSCSIIIVDQIVRRPPNSFDRDSDIAYLSQY